MSITCPEVLFLQSLKEIAHLVDRCKGTAEAVDNLAQKKRFHDPVARKSSGLEYRLERALTTVRVMG